MNFLYNLYAQSKFLEQKAVEVVIWHPIEENIWLADCKFIYDSAV